MNNIRSILLSLIFLFSIQNVFAQESEKIENIEEEVSHKVLGFIQFTEGSLVWVSESGEKITERSEPEYKDLVHDGDIISLKDKAILKIVTDELCTGAIYGPGKVQVTATSSVKNLWKIESPSIRWICPKGKKQELVINNKNTFIDEGELALKDDKIYSRRELVKLEDNQLERGKLYNLSKGSAVEKQPTPYGLWRFDNKIKKPVESVTVNQPNRQYKKRLIFSMGPGGGSINHEDDLFDSKDADSFNLNIQYQTLWKANRSLIFNFGRVELENNNNNGGNGSEIEMFNADAGIRWNHYRSWSYYTRAGIGLGNIRGNSGGPNQLFLQFRSQSVYALLRLGVEKIFFRDRVDRWNLKGWHGIYANVELNLIKSLSSKFDGFDGAGFGGNSSDVAASETQSRAAAEKGLFAATILFNIGIPFGLDEG